MLVIGKITCRSKRCVDRIRRTCNFRVFLESGIGNVLEIRRDPFGGIKSFLDFWKIS